MTATTEAPTTNLHQPVERDGNHLDCGAPDCGYSMFTHPIATPTFKDQPEKMATYWRDQFQRHHSDQYAPGRAPDIAVDWEVSACCSICEDKIGDIVVVDSETLTCKDCGTTWDMHGTSGELAEQEED
ncbi:hypothetical protein SEA_MUFASA8_69 [Arthrobacter phage Mufasa8]|uniref:Uncharacterized protein n=1 Tax=Arthrobacter phage Mufasa8 TaxID=2656526 RepID=A0A649VM94_9CAUD|nr:hypothetical protein HYQ08_gp069 [Arthrobacter phage Mufasa8]QGJ93517.1 hypothetical protein SEA_MUFASA8_69 [Arthrobacter phage Mufasa8]